MVGFRRTFRVSLPSLITVFYHPVFMLFEESVCCGTILCSLFVPSGVFRRDDILYARSDAESASFFCSRTLLAEIYDLNPEGWLHNLSIRVHSNALSAGWSRDHTTTLIIRFCILNGGSMQFYSFHGS